MILPEASCFTDQIDEFLNRIAAFIRLVVRSQPGLAQFAGQRVSQWFPLFGSNREFTGRGKTWKHLRLIFNQHFSKKILQSLRYLYHVNVHL